MRQDYLEIQKSPPVDESVIAYNIYEYTPIVGTSLNNSGGQIRIAIETQDIFTHPSKSYLHISGSVTKAADGALYAVTDILTLVNNAAAFLFDKISYEMHGQTVDFTLNPGIASTMKNIISLGSEEQMKAGRGWWYLDQHGAGTASITDNSVYTQTHKLLIKNPTTKGNFNIAIPLSSLMGFFEDYDKVLYGAKQTLILSRGGNNNAIFKAAGADLAKVTISSLSWCMPQVKLSDIERENVFSLVERKVPVPIKFRHWHLDQIALQQTTSTTWSLQTTTAVETPRWIIVGFQTARDNSQLKNTACFDHCKLENVQATLNSETYPVLPFNADFAGGEYAKLYNTVLDYRRENYGREDLSFGMDTYKDNFPLVAIDCTKQNEKIKGGYVNIQLKMRFKAAVPASTICYALIISDRQMLYHMADSKI